MRVRVHIISPEGQAQPRDAVADVIRLGRGTACEIAVDPDDFPKVSKIHAMIEATPEGYSLVPLSQLNKTLLNDQPVEDSTPIRAGDRVRLGFAGPTVEILFIEPESEPPQYYGGDGETIQADGVHLALLRGTAGAERFEVRSGGVIGRDAQAVQFLLDHPLVSRRHARLTVEGRRVVLSDLGSSNGTYVKGQRLARPTALKAGDRVDIGPFSLVFDGADLVGRSRANNIELAASGLKRAVRDRSTGKPLTLLQDVSLVIRPREFVCLLGPSGSGKTTLLAILSGRNPPDSGAVAVNDEDLYAHFEALKGDIAVVPQKDVLHDSLTVGAALRYTAELRLPPDTSRNEIDASVSDILEVVGLTKRRGTLIRHLSGGQVKRASLANELIARPSLLFLDEVTSGLDEQTDREVMELFRRVADGGRTVACVTHALANIEATAHLVVILTEGGRLAFVGSPDEAKAYFDVPRLGEVYRKLAGRTPEEWQNRFRASPYFRRYVTERLSANPVIGGPVRSPSVPPARRRMGNLRQARILSRRYVSIWRGNRHALLVMLGQSVLVGVLLGLVFGDLGALTNPAERVPRTVNLLLMLAVSCFWFGCNTAAKELVKERVIFLRERDFNLRVGGYFASKFLILAMIGVTQAMLLFGIVRVVCGLAGEAASQGATLAALAVAGTAVGLFLSAWARSEEVATALVPIAVIPQIIFAGVMAPLSGAAALLAKGLVTVHWGQQALERSLTEGDLKLLGAERADGFGSLVVVLAHAVAAAVATIFALRNSGTKPGQ